MVSGVAGRPGLLTQLTAADLLPDAHAAATARAMEEGLKAIKHTLEGRHRGAADRPAVAAARRHDHHVAARARPSPAEAGDEGGQVIVRVAPVAVADAGSDHV
jgi:hypothetical protein